MCVRESVRVCERESMCVRMCNCRYECVMARACYIRYGRVIHVSDVRERERERERERDRER